MKSLYATKLLLKPEAMQRLKIRDPYSLHRVVYDLFPQERTPEEVLRSVPSRIQWLDDGEHIDGRRVLILSDQAPVASVASDVEIVTNLVPESFLKHNRYAFCLTANVVTQIAGKRRALTDRVKIEQWMTRRGRECGFEADVQCVDRIRALSFKKGEHSVTLCAARIAGYLSVRDQNLFVEAVHRGIGRGRAWGLGMLQLSIPNHIFEN